MSIHILSLSDVKTIKAIELHDIEKLNCWGKDNLVLIGDCAHAPLPASGQGACLALEDSLALRNIINSNVEIDEIHRELFESRRIRCHAVQDFGRKNTQLLFP